MIFSLEHKVIIFLLLGGFTASGSFCQIDDSLVIKYNYINSIPQNAEVYYNDSLIGFTPVRTVGHFIYPGVISVKLKDYLEYRYQLQPVDSLINETFYLLPVTKKFRGKGQNLVTENKSITFKKPRKPIPITALGTVTLGSAVSAYYFKNLANNKYDEYLNSGKQELLDETKRYDLISGISLAVFQLGLLGLIYFLFID